MIFKHAFLISPLITIQSPNSPQNGALLHVSDRNDHWLITPKYIEPQTDAPQQTQTWVNVSQMPPSPMRSRRPIGGGGSASGSPAAAAMLPTGPFDNVEPAFPSLAFNLGPGAAAAAASSLASLSALSPLSSPSSSSAAASASSSHHYQQQQYQQQQQQYQQQQQQQQQSGSSSMFSSAFAIAHGGRAGPSYNNSRGGGQ
jgi:hypothetical protein